MAVWDQFGVASKHLVVEGRVHQSPVETNAVGSLPTVHHAIRHLCQPLEGLARFYDHA